MSVKKINLGLLGCGVVGSGLVELIRKNRALVAERSGVELNIRRVLIRDPAKARPVDRSVLTTEAEAVVGADDIDIVVEVMGGVEPARSYISRALETRKNVVTANKALLAQSGGDLFRLAATHRKRIGFEASVCAGIPLIHALQHGLVGNKIESLCGIVNGTCNYILTRMTEDGLTFESALAKAQANGFCEADPSLDLDGIDAAQKLILLAEIAFGAEVAISDVLVEGIRRVEAEDIRRAKALGYVIKHIAVARDVEGKLDLRVHPALLPAIHPLAAVRNEFNAVQLRGDAVGEMIFEGKGAGSLPTASAVLADIIEIARNGHDGPVHVPPAGDPPLVEDIRSRFYLRFPIVDLPGVIGLITTALGNHGVSISHATATLAESPGLGNVTILAHDCSERTLRRAIEEISRLPILQGKPVVLRIFEEGA